MFLPCRHLVTCVNCFHELRKVEFLKKVNAEARFSNEDSDSHFEVDDYHRLVAVEPESLPLKDELGLISIPKPLPWCILCRQAIIKIAMTYVN